MESEKVKEIKTALECCGDKVTCQGCPEYNNEPVIDWFECKKNLLQKTINLINELESENELLRNAKVVYETVDYCYEDLKKAEKRIAELEDKIMDGTLLEFPRIIHPNEREWFVYFQLPTGIINYDILYSQVKAEARLKELQEKK